MRVVEREGPIDLSMLAPPRPVATKRPIRQLLGEYGHADEKFVRAMVADLPDVDLDRVKARQKTAAENRKTARENMMRALWSMHLLEEQSEEPSLQDEVARLSRMVKYLEAEKGKGEAREAKLKKRMEEHKEKYTRVVLGLEEEKEKAEAEKAAVQAEAEEMKKKGEGLENELEVARAEAQSAREGLEALKGKVPELQRAAIDEFRAGPEGPRAFMQKKSAEWSEKGWLDVDRMVEDIREEQRKKRAEAAGNAGTADRDPGNGSGVVAGREEETPAEPEVETEAEAEPEGEQGAGGAEGRESEPVVE